MRLQTHKVKSSMRPSITPSLLTECESGSQKQTLCQSTQSSPITEQNNPPKVRQRGSFRTKPRPRTLTTDDSRGRPSIQLKAGTDQSVKQRCLNNIEITRLELISELANDQIGSCDEDASFRVKTLIETKFGCLRNQIEAILSGQPDLEKCNSNTVNFSLNMTDLEKLIEFDKHIKISVDKITHLSSLLKQKIQLASSLHKKSLPADTEYDSQFQIDGEVHETQVFLDKLLMQFFQLRTHHTIKAMHGYPRQQKNEEVTQPLDLSKALSSGSYCKSDKNPNKASRFSNLKTLLKPVDQNMEVVQESNHNQKARDPARLYKRSVKKKRTERIEKENAFQKDVYDASIREKDKALQDYLNDSGGSKTLSSQSAIINRFYRKKFGV